MKINANSNKLSTVRLYFLFMIPYILNYKFLLHPPQQLLHSKSPHTHTHSHTFIIEEQKIEI